MSTKKSPRLEHAAYIGPPEQAGQDVYEVVRRRYWFSRDLTVALLLDSDHEVLGCSVVGIGPRPSVEPDEVFRSARQANATAVILARIDASADGRPTTDDRRLFETLQEAGDAAGIHVFDYLVIEDGSWFSFLEQQLL